MSMNFFSSFWQVLSVASFLLFHFVGLLREGSFWRLVGVSCWNDRNLGCRCFPPRFEFVLLLLLELVCTVNYKSHFSFFFDLGFRQMLGLSIYYKTNTGALHERLFQPVFPFFFFSSRGIACLWWGSAMLEGYLIEYRFWFYCLVIIKQLLSPWISKVCLLM